MAEADISKIIGLIMENPNLVEQIRALADKTDKSENENTDAVREKIDEPSIKASTVPQPKSKRRELLTALKPYLSDERSKAVDQMLSIGDILEMMRSK